MDSALTRTQFALDALVAAGHVTQAKVDEALALSPAPAGEPEMPANAAYWWSPKDGAMAGTWSSNTGPHPDWDVTHYFTADQLRAYGDARAEHARIEIAERAIDLVALHGGPVDLEAAIRSIPTWSQQDATGAGEAAPTQESEDAARYRLLRQYRVDSYLACGEGGDLDAAIDAIRSAAPPQGEPDAR